MDRLFAKSLSASSNVLSVLTSSIICMIIEIFTKHCTEITRCFIVDTLIHKTNHL